MEGHLPVHADAGAGAGEQQLAMLSIVFLSEKKEDSDIEGTVSWLFPKQKMEYGDIGGDRRRGVRTVLHSEIAGRCSTTKIVSRQR